MSEQIRPCKMVDNCNHEQTAETCNKDCEYYNPEDDSELINSLPEEEIKMDNGKTRTKIVNSGFEKFNKSHEFIVLKKHVFEIQSVSPKKLILKFKRKLKKDDVIMDGCYVFKTGGEIQNVHKVFTQMK